MPSSVESGLSSQDDLGKDVTRIIDSLGGERNIFRACYSFYRSQYPRKSALSPTAKMEEIEWTALCAAALSEGTSPEDVLSRVRGRIRSDAKTLMLLAESEVFDRYNETRAQYKAKLRSYAGRHPLTADARSIWDLDGERDEHIADATAVGTLPIDSSADHWQKIIAAEIEALKGVNSLTAAMSSSLLNWTKYIDDKRRLNVALAALLAGLLLNGGSMILQYIWQDVSPIVYTYDCISRQGGMKCVATQVR